MMPKKGSKIKKASEAMKVALPIIAVGSLVFSQGPCTAPEWRFLKKAEAAHMVGEVSDRVDGLEDGISRIEGKIELLVDMVGQLLTEDEKK